MQSALLIGNGLNRCYKGAIPWDKLLERIANEYNVQFNDNNPFPLEFESIANQILDKDKRNANEVYDELKARIASMVCSQSPTPNSLQRLFTLDIPADHILTTNYDYMLEKAFTEEPEPKPSSQDKRETKYSLFRFEKHRGKTFYHIHGEAGKGQSLCLGYEHYAAYLSKMREYLKAPPGVSEKIFKAEWLKKHSWVDLFFTHDVYIVGLTLETNEIDLWWLLTYRAFLYYSNDAGLRDIMKNRIKIFLTRNNPDQQDLFHNLHVETELIEVRDKSYEDAYREIAKKIKQEIFARNHKGNYNKQGRNML